MCLEENEGRMCLERKRKACAWKDRSRRKEEAYGAAG